MRMILSGTRSRGLGAVRKALWALFGALAALCPSAATASGREVDGLDGARYQAGQTDAGSGGLSLLSGADGVPADVVRAGRPGVTPRAGTNPPSAYLYFRVANGAVRPTPEPIYVVVEYFDEVVGSSGLRLDYDSAGGDDLAGRYHAADDQAGGAMVDTKRWQTAAFLLRQPGFARRENVGADFRLSGGRPIIHSVRLTRTRPTNWDRLATLPPATLRPLVKIGPGGQLIVGGFDVAHPSDAAPQARSLESSAAALKQLGVTSHEGYVRWNLCEVAPGKYDWSVYDRFVEVYKRHNLKWVPFLIIGSAYSLPNWYYRSAEAQGYVCLEHGQESDVQSHWNPNLRRHVASFIQAFCEHYRGSGVIESIMLGITGNYGEAIYPVSGNDWTADIHGPYHSHPGYWAGDRYAVRSFRQWLAHRYGCSEALRRAWGSHAADLHTARPFLQKQASNDRAWLDMTNWYIGSMTDWARFWLRTTRSNFPKGDIYLCTGGHAPPEHGSDFGAQCKAAAEFGAGVRITNESSDLRGNFSLTRWVASAARQYGAYFSFEPAGAVNAEGVIARIYNATTSGARGLHYYYPNLFDTEQAHQNFIRFGAQFRQRKPVEEIAVFYPTTYIKLHGNDFLQYVQPLRDRFDFDYVSEGQIADGGLAKVKALLLLEGDVAEAQTWRRIADWVRGGGLLIRAGAMGTLRTVEASDAPERLLFGPKRDLGKGRVVLFAGRGDSVAYRDLVTRRLATAPELSRGARAMIAADGVEDGVFVSLCGQNELVWLNTTPDTVRKTVPLAVALPPSSIVNRRLPSGR